MKGFFLLQRFYLNLLQVAIAIAYEKNKFITISSYFWQLRKSLRVNEIETAVYNNLCDFLLVKQ